ncbi:MAG: pyridoxal-dependent decarboxylase, exosortase A system-associated [Rhodocyclaceae bacterium]|nr:pyridoxal-dependent decarboxylase, exosortase A system-associated [Rhodocyclaceae bacterium]
MTQFAVVAGELQVGGQPLTRIAARIGQTPFYAYDRSLITARVAELRRALPDAIRLHYAMKANPMPALVCHMAGLVDGIDVASAGELQVALDSGCSPDEISFAGPGKRVEELQRAVAAGILVNVESARELPALADAGERLGVAARVALRVNPPFELKSSGMRMGGGPKPFGIDAEQVPALLGEIGRLGLAFEGFHIFAGSQNLQADAIIDAQQNAYRLAVELAAGAPAPVRVLNLGGGFGIPYFPGETRLPLDAIALNLEEIARRAAVDLPGTRLVLELGRYLVGEAGIYVCRVIDRKRSRGHTYLVTDGGLHHNLAASGNFGQVLRKNYPVMIGNRAGHEAAEPCTVVGPLCTPLDIIAAKVALPDAAVGDLVVVFQSGAYGASASPAAFLSHPACAEALV